MNMMGICCYRFGLLCAESKVKLNIIELTVIKFMKDVKYDQSAILFKHFESCISFV